MLQQQMSGGEAGTALKAFANKAAEADQKFAKLAATGKTPIRIRTIDENGQLRAMPDILADLREAYGPTLEATERLQIQQALGNEEAIKLIDALYGREEAVRANAEALETAADRGAEFTQEMARAADSNWDSAMVLMSQKMDVLRQKIGERLLPVVDRLVPVFDAFIERAFNWIDANPRLVTGIGAVVVGLGALAAIVAPILLGASALVSAWATMSYGATRLTLGLLNFNKTTGKAQGLIGRLGRGVMWLGRKVLPIVGRALLAIGRVLMANPLGLAITAIAGAAYLVYKHWEPISDFFSGLWENVKSAAATAWDWLKSLFMRYTPHGLILTHWESIAGFFAGLWERVKSGVSAGWDRIKSAFLDYTPLGLVFKHWDSITETFAGYWDSIKAGVSKGWDAIKALFLTYHPVGMVISNWDSIVDTFAGYWSSIKSGISTGWDRIKTAFLDYTPAGLIVSNWDGITETFAGYWSTIKTGISTGWDAIKTLFMDYHPIGMLISNWDGIADTFSGYWSAIQLGVSEGWDQVKTALAEYGASTLIHEAWTGLDTWFATFWDQVKTTFKDKWEEIKAEVATWPAQMKQYGSDLIQSLIDGIRAKFAALGQAVSEALSKLNPFSSASANVSVSGTSASAAPASGQPPAGIGPNRRFAKGGSFSPGWIMVGEEGPEARFESRSGFIAHNKALQGMVAMASRAREMINGLDMGAAFGAEPAIIPAMSAIAPMGAERGGSQITFAPVTHMPPLTLDRGVDIEEAQALFAAMLNERDEQIAADQRRLLHDV
jgi:phage-related minor tail protein